MNDRPKGHQSTDKQFLIGVVGPCASGKSTLVAALRNRGYNAREIKQEHSYVATMWQQVTHPDLLIYLHVSQGVASQRRAAEAGAAWWNELEERLRHARRHADLHLDTDHLSLQEVLDKTLSFLKQHAS